MTLSIDEVTEAVESGDYVGFCTACGEAHTGIEPDAENYNCENCGKDKVFGAEQILIMGLCS